MRRGTPPVTTSSHGPTYDTSRLERQRAAGKVLDRARVDPVLCLVGGGGVLVHQRDCELLSRGSELTRCAVERRQRDVLNDALDATRPRQVAILAGIGDRHGLRLGARCKGG